MTFSRFDATLKLLTENSQEFRLLEIEIYTRIDLAHIPKILDSIS